MRCEEFRERWLAQRYRAHATHSAEPPARTGPTEQARAAGSAASTRRGAAEQTAKPAPSERERRQKVSRSPSTWPSADLALNVHLDGCKECQGFVQEQEALDALLTAETETHPSPGFDTRFFARLDALKQKQPASLWDWLRQHWALASATAALLLAVAVASWGSMDGPPKQPSPTALPPPEDLALLADLELARDLELIQRLDEVEAYRVLAHVEMEELEAALEEQEP